jgi:hypothetical protein
MVMSPEGHGTKNDCAGESQQQYIQQTDLSMPHFKTHKSFEKKKKILSLVPTGPETKTYCAGEAQQQLNRQTGSSQSIVLYVTHRSFGERQKLT